MPLLHETAHQCACVLLHLSGLHHGDGTLPAEPAPFARACGDLTQTCFSAGWARPYAQKVCTCKCTLQRQLAGWLLRCRVCPSPIAGLALRALQAAVRDGTSGATGWLVIQHVQLSRYDVLEHRPAFRACGCRLRGEDASVVLLPS
jgi:hypothetical protein